MPEIRAIMTLLATMWRNGPGHADITGSHSTWAGWERHREKVITDLIGKDESIYLLWSEGQAFQGVLSLSTLAAYTESMRENGAGSQGARPDAITTLATDPSTLFCQEKMDLSN